MERTSRSVVITGASGIAAATARQLADAGDAVFVISRNPGSCAALVDSLGSEKAGWYAADLQDEEATVAAFNAAAKKLGRIDAVVAVAGGSARRFGDGWLHEMTLDAWNASINLNLTTIFLTAREAVRHMKGTGGSLVLTSSVLATSPQPDNFTTHGYAAAKASITGWTVPLAAAYAKDKVRVNCVAPGLVRTPMAARAAEDPEIVSFAERKQPVAPGMLTAEQIAEALCWFVHSDGVTGQVLAVDGGWAVTSTS
ncbi:SDR family NAD(P)-dependent oxidoreductase [Arthrobacter sp. YN]|uniref:SDR family NAD(P)-dependent oxidoreductase n=1 Tax=Arthrobacter sp. YN TaxID=2020486 RepID=UPI0012FDB570|nr:SDR family oxidoreductase [Arthrobacter sp. YN]